MPRQEKPTKQFTDPVHRGGRLAETSTGPIDAYVAGRPRPTHAEWKVSSLPQGGSLHKANGINPNLKTLETCDTGEHSYQKLLSLYQHKQRDYALMKAMHQEAEDTLEHRLEDLQLMTQKYLAAQAEADQMRAKYAEACTQVESLESKLKIVSDAKDRLAEDNQRLIGENRALRASLGEVDGSNDEKTPTNSTDSRNPVVAISRDVSNSDVTERLKAINSRLLAIAHTCTAASSFKAGVKKIQIDNKMTVDLTSAIGYVMIDFLRSEDHSADNSGVKLALQGVLAHQLARTIDGWPIPFIDVDSLKLQRSSDGRDHDPIVPHWQSLTANERTKFLDDTYSKLATTLCLAGVPGNVLAVIDKIRESISKDVEELFRMTAQFANLTHKGTPATEFKILYAKPGATIDKDVMQQRSRLSPKLWMHSTKKTSLVLCTRELGVRSLRKSKKPEIGEVEGSVLIKVLVAIESEIHK